MTNYLDKEGLKKFWEITKGKYSAVGHNHDDRYLKIGATAADSNKLGGYASSVYKRVMYIGVKQDYQDTVILLWKDGEKSECFANGLLYTTTYGATRGQYADLRLRFSRWGADYLYNLHFQFNAYGEGVRMRLITCTYEGEKWWAIQHTNIQATVFNFSDLGSYGVSWKPIIYYNQNTKQVLNQEIYDSIVDQSSKLSTYYVGDARNALTTDIPTKLSQLSDDVVKGKYLPLTGGRIEGNLFIAGENSYLRCSSSNGAVRLYASTNRGLYDDTTGRWIVATIKENGNTMMMNGNVGINTTAPDSRLHVNGTFHSVGASTLDSTLSVGGAATLNSSLTVKGETSVQGLTANGNITVENGKYLSVKSSDSVFARYTHYGILFSKTVNDSTNALTFPSKGGMIALADDMLAKSGGTISGVLMVNGAVTMQTTLKVTGNVGIGTDADAAYKLKVNGKAYFSASAIVNGDLQVNGAINNGDFYTDMDGWAYTTQLNINDGGDLVMYDSNGDKHILNLQKAIELGVFS